jgi:hypothetical protein
LSVGGDGADPDDPEAEGITSEMFGQTFFYDAFTPKYARELLEAAGFEIEHGKSTTHPPTATSPSSQEKP